MNGYLLRKCRSEQQLMNELTKLLGSKDYASKKMSELLKELAFFYVSPVLPRIPHSVLKDLCALLTNLKDKKEDLRIAKMVLCFLARLVDQFELRYQLRGSSSSSDEQRTQSFELSVSVVATLMKVMEKSELSHASLPRQNTCLKLFAHLCRVFSKTDVLILRVKPLMQKSPVWALLSGDKKTIAAVTGKKDFPAQLAQLAAMFHGVRFHMSHGEQETMLELLFQAAFLPTCVASRHACATLLALFELSSELAKTVVKSLEWFLMKFRPTTLRVGDTLATIYLLRLCGQISRLPTADDQSSTGGNSTNSSFSKNKSNKSSSVSNLLDLSYDMGGAAPVGGGGAASPPPSPVARQRQRLDGVTVSGALATRLKDMLLDVLCAASEQKTATTTASTWVANAVVLVAIEETVKDSDAESCFMKVRGSVCVFEIVAGLLLKMLRDAAPTNVVMLHRLCRVIQFTAECLDGAVLQMTGSAHQPQFLDKITERVVDSASHSNPFIACESLRALVWLLPRLASNAPSGWELLMTRLIELPVDQISPESRVTISEAFFHRAVTNPSLNQHQIDTELLKKCLVVTLSWFQTSPCEWHAAMLVRVWQTALRKSLATMGDDVFRSINAVLDFQHHHRHLKVTTELVKRSTLDFLLRLGAKFTVHRPSWFQALSLRLTKQMLLESLISRRLSVQVILQLNREAQQLGKNDIVTQLGMLMAYLKQADPSANDDSDPSEHAQQMKRNPDVFVETRIHSQAVKDSLGIHDLILQSGLEARAPSIAARPGASASNPFFNGAPAATSSAMAFDGVF